MKLRTNKLLALLLVIVILFNSADINIISLASDMDNGFNSELILSDDTSNNSTIGNNEPAPDDGYSVTYSYNIPNYKVSDKIAKKLLNSYKNKDIKLPKLSSKGYTFLGWFIDDIKISKISKNNVLCKGNITVEARFAYKPSKVKNAIKPGVSGNIIIDYDGGTSKKTLSSNGLNLNKSVKLPKPKKEGYKFLGWFVGNTKVTKLDYKLDVCMPYNNGETLTCKAKWTPSEVTIKFNKNGSKTKGKIAPYVTYVNAITILPECTLVKDNLKFAYWSTKKKGVGISIPNSSFKINKLGIKLKKTLKLYANYSEEGLKKDDNLGVNITLDTSAFTYNEAGDWYVVDTLVSKLTGKVSKAENIDSFSYVMKDAFGNTVKKADLEAKEKLEINNFGFVVGYNELIFDIEEKNGVCKEQKFGFFNSNEDNQKETDIDFSDTDGDGLDNYYESIIGTNPLKADTDGDMLNDYQELLLTGTDPTLSDTDSDGVNDADEDNDEDGLTNINEIKIGTDCKNKDTDGDTLSDGDEVNKYKTNPLLWDTDGDGLSDGQEVELKYDPNKSDTDGNGIKDADETKYQTYEEKIENEEHPGVSQVSISLDSDGYLGEKATIMDTYNLDMRSTELAGLIGSPVDIEYDGTFDSAELVFTYDESKLGDTSEEDLALMWYDEANDQYVFLDSELDTVKNTVSYKTTHFSSYMLVDKKKTLKAFTETPNYRSLDNSLFYDMVFVVDASGSMSDEDENGNFIDKFEYTKNAMKLMVSAMQDFDRIGIVSFSLTAERVVNLTNSQDIINTDIELMTASLGTIPDTGIEDGISVLDDAEAGKTKTMVFICDGDETLKDPESEGYDPGEPTEPYQYNAELVAEAKSKNITIYCINEGMIESSAMKRMASETGGLYFHATTEKEILEAMNTIRSNTLLAVDTTDTDGDGLYDVYEINGMKTSNGQLIFSDYEDKFYLKNEYSFNTQYTDFEMMGGKPTLTYVKLYGEEYWVEVFHPIFNEISTDFIYVDGRKNKDGTVYNDKMDHMPVSDHYLQIKYNLFNNLKENDAESIWWENQIYKYYGAAYGHNLLKNKGYSINESEKRVLVNLDVSIYLSILCLTSFDFKASEVFFAYISGGGDQLGWVDGHTRKIIDASDYILKNSLVNPERTAFYKNLACTKEAVNFIINDYNNDMYISVSPETLWTGGAHLAKENIDNGMVIGIIKTPIQIKENIAAFGTFNTTEAGITAHCTYNSETNEITMHYKYYLVDFYDYAGLYWPLQVQDALGMANSFELYGYYENELVWEKY